MAFEQLLAYFLFLVPRVVGDCSRSTSRIVRNAFNQELIPVYVEQQLSVPVSCPLSEEHDVFALQERHKYLDNPGKWTCEFCGKGFYDEKFLDKHFEVRHEDRIPTGEHVTCLADYCDIFRCDIISGRVKPHFWDIALCKEREMARLFNKCQDLVHLCIPTTASTDQHSVLYNVLNTSLCSFLTCEKFWDTKNYELPRHKTVLYIIASVFILFGTFIYYFIAYTHFFTDESLLDTGRHRHEPPHKNVYNRHHRYR